MSEEQLIGRRQFFHRIQLSFVRWSPMLGLMGFRMREHVYRYTSGGTYKVVWIEWCGKAVGFLNDIGKIVWLGK